MARKAIEGTGDKVSAPEYDDDMIYEVKLTAPVEYPPGSRSFLLPDHYVEVRGRALKKIDAALIVDVKDAIVEPAPTFEDEITGYRRSNLTSVKDYRNPSGKK